MSYKVDKVAKNQQGFVSTRRGIEDEMAMLAAGGAEVEDELPNFEMMEGFAPENGTPVHMLHEAVILSWQQSCASS